MTHIHNTNNLVKYGTWFPARKVAASITLMELKRLLANTIDGNTRALLFELIKSAYIQFYNDVRFKFDVEVAKECCTSCCGDSCVGFDFYYKSNKSEPIDPQPVPPQPAPKQMEIHVAYLDEVDGKDMQRTPNHNSRVVGTRLVEVGTEWSDDKNLYTWLPMMPAVEQKFVDFAYALDSKLENIHSNIQPTDTMLGYRIINENEKWSPNSSDYKWLKIR